MIVAPKMVYKIYARDETGNSDHSYLVGVCENVDQILSALVIDKWLKITYAIDNGERVTEY